jgi:hypothetical protein
MTTQILLIVKPILLFKVFIKRMVRSWSSKCWRIK